MANYNTNPAPYDQVIAEAFALPNAGVLPLTNVCTIDAKASGSLWVRVYAADTTVEFVNPNTIAFHPVVGTTALAVKPANSLWASVTGTILPGCFISAISATANSTISFTSGQLICEFALPKTQIAALDASNTAGTAKSNNIYLAVWAVAVGDESADNIEAYLYVE